MDHLYLTSAEESRITESTLCKISGKTFRTESALTALVQKKPVALLVGGINFVSVEVKSSN